MTSVRETVTAKADLQALEAKLDAVFKGMITKADLRAAKRELIIWFAGILIAHDVVNATVEGGLINWL